MKKLTTIVSALLFAACAMAQNHPSVKLNLSPCFEKGQANGLAEIGTAYSFGLSEAFSAGLGLGFGTTLKNGSVMEGGVPVRYLTSAYLPLSLNLTYVSGPYLKLSPYIALDFGYAFAFARSANAYDISPRTDMVTETSYISLLEYKSGISEERSGFFGKLSVGAAIRSNSLFVHRTLVGLYCGAAQWKSASMIRCGGKLEPYGKDAIVSGIAVKTRGFAQNLRFELGLGLSVEF